MTPCDICHMLAAATRGVGVDLVDLTQAVGALREACANTDLLLPDPDLRVVDALLLVLPADEISFNDIDLPARHSVTLELLPTQTEEHHSGLWEHFCDTLNRSYPERTGSAPGRGCDDGRLYSADQWHSADMYTDRLGHCGLDHALVVPPLVPLGGGAR